MNTMSKTLLDLPGWLLSQLRGWRTDRKIVVFESDDWGAIRMPGRQQFESLKKSGIEVGSSPYDRLDSLERKEDLHALLNVLSGHRSSRGEKPIFTMNMVMGNPDFEKIERDDFQRFHHESFIQSYQIYYGESFENDWLSAMNEGLVRQQFHAREHLNSTLWLRDLKAGLEPVRTAFRHRFYGLKAKTSSAWQRHYKAAYCAESPSEVEAIKGIFSNGMAMFETAFGFHSRSFVACNYVLPEELEQHSATEGVQLIQSQRGYVRPDPAKGGQRTVCRPFAGKRNDHGQKFSVRNVLFEPYLAPDEDWAGRAFREVALAFRLRKPAVVCTHRVNYSGHMDLEHRDRSLFQLDCLLRKIIKTWSDVEFLSSDQLLDAMGRSD